MGQAKNRGTFEERKAEALDEGREKVKTSTPVRYIDSVDPIMAMILPILMRGAIKPYYRG